LDEAEAIKLFHAAIDRGIHFSDHSWDYSQGESERRIGKALQGCRNRMSVMTNIRWPHEAIRPWNNWMSLLSVSGWIG
jgi:aryl-alcohol dehydrogenase-like predicted oxidoreductase